MKEENDIAWKPIMYCSAALLGGLALGIWVLAPIMEKRKEKLAAKKNTTSSKKA